ncbi:MAG: quinolinate synthase NadA [Bacteroidia bacterium]|nr:quinolinate synthase NadA [Bacteroidia bacterium]MCC6767826.1 quinolinate synthase NadA [Bacteroidia bacterium]
MIQSELLKNGFLEKAIEPSLDLFAEIKRLKQEKNAIVLAHYYQNADIQDVADYIGDSLGLAQQAAKTKADMIVFAGVHFMAETAKILCPDKKVVLPDLNAGCSLADSCTPDRFAAFKAQHPEHMVISYINCTAEIKAMTDIVCTSSNAAQIVQSLPKDQKIIFAPDKNLGRYIMQTSGREMLLWDGSCMVHEIFSKQKIVQLKLRYPDAEVIAHPECEEAVLELADFIGSTSALLKRTKQGKASTFIVATESGILHQMIQASPEKTFIPAPPDNQCACNDCPHMKLNTLEKVYLCMEYELPELILDEQIRKKAEVPIRRMLDISASLGL